MIRAQDVTMHRLLGSDLPDEECFDIQINCILTHSQSKISGYILNSDTNTGLSAAMSRLITMSTRFAEGTYCKDKTQ